MKIEETKLTAISEALKVDKAALTAELDKVDEAVDVKFDSTKGEFLTKDNRTTLEKNMERTFFNQAKIAHKRDLFRNFKEQYGVEANPETDDTASILPKIEEAIVKKANISEPESVKKLNDDLGKLRITTQEITRERDNLKTEFEGYKKKSAITGELAVAISSLPIEGETPEKIANGREILQTMFEKKYRLDTEDGKTVVKDASGNILKNNLQEPMKLSEVLTGFAPGYVSLSSSTAGRGDASSKNNNALSGELKNIKNKNEFEAYLKNKGINAFSSEAGTLLKELKSANPDYK